MSYKIIILSAILPIAILQHLNNIPITFQLSGLTTYVPDTGGVAIPGYIFTLGYNYKSWIGIQFMKLTSSNNYDTLILERSSTQSGGFYTCTIKDYYISAGRPGVLSKDIQTSVDRVVTSSKDKSYFQLTISRTIGNTNGEDWQGGQISEVCFFTSDQMFSQTKWTAQYQSCFGYTTISYLSVFKGSPLGSMNFQGIQSTLYGGFFDNYLNLKLFWYRNNIAMSNTSNIIIRIGQNLGQLVGYDFYQCGVGDFHGSELDLQRDLDYHGYEDGVCSYTLTGSSVLLNYNRKAYTYDQFDTQIGASTTFCIIGSQTSCKQINLPTLFPIMTIKSALQLSQMALFLNCILMIIMISMII